MLTGAILFVIPLSTSLYKDEMHYSKHKHSSLLRTCIIKTERLWKLPGGGFLHSLFACLSKFP